MNRSPEEIAEEEVVAAAVVPSPPPSFPSGTPPSAASFLSLSRSVSSRKLASALIIRACWRAPPGTAASRVRLLSGVAASKPLSASHPIVACGLGVCFRVCVVPCVICCDCRCVLYRVVCGHNILSSRSCFSTVEACKGGVQAVGIDGMKRVSKMEEFGNSSAARKRVGAPRNFMCTPVIVDEGKEAPKPFLR